MAKKTLLESNMYSTIASDSRDVQGPISWGLSTDDLHTFAVQTMYDVKWANEDGKVGIHWKLPTGAAALTVMLWPERMPAWNSPKRNAPYVSKYPLFFHPLFWFLNLFFAPYFDDPEQQVPCQKY